ncbi:MAG: alpha/beta fold hydrolase [Marinirhabdus sp.]|nr:alpha/beta fold hydrolase [Marinirhabdus sp.]
MTIERNEILLNSSQKPIVYDAYYAPDGQKKPVVVFCHGYKGFKDWGAWNLVAEAFAEQGFFFLKFNFSHNGGTLLQPIDFPDLEAFAQNNYSKELEDLQQILDFITLSERFQTEVDKEDINLIGHSRGGGIALIKAEESADVKRVVTWAGVSDYRSRFDEGSESFKAWKRTGRKYVENGRTKQQMPHDWQFYEDFKANEDRLTIKRAASNISKPYLIIHGDADPTVSLSEAKRLSQWNPKAELKIIEGADHVFGAKHPWEGLDIPDDLRKITEVTIKFLWGHF